MIRAMGRVLRHPSVNTFKSESTHAKLGSAILVTCFVGAVAGFIGGCINLLLADSSVADILVLTIITPLRLVVALLVAQAFLFVTARALRGQGEFDTQAYLGALVFAPLYALATLVAVLPVIGAWLAFAVLLWNVALNVPALRAVHGGDSWRVWNVALLGLSFVAGTIAWFAISSLAL